MSSTLNKLRPGQLLSLLNSFEYGEIIQARTLKRLRDRAGLQISDDAGKTVNLFKLTAWAFDQRHAPKKKERDKSGDYEKKKEAERHRNAEVSKSGRDIGDLPSVKNPDRKAQAEFNFRFYCEQYFPETFELEWSDDHLLVIERIENAVLHGGLSAVAMPRGEGKSTLAEIACLWASSYGHQPFTALIGATEAAALEMLDSLKITIETNDRLFEDFPELCYPIQKLEGINNRCAGQLYHGKQTRISWTSKEIILPTIADAKCSGVIVRVSGITGRIRGMKYKRPDGVTVRPSLVIIDDPQTKESAGSLDQTRKRMSIINGDILGLAGPGKKIAGIMPCTVIEPGDMADQILDREKHPEWNAIRTKMMIDFPVNEALWDQYAEIRAESLRVHGDIRDATEFYRENREAMDAGAKVSWEARFNHDEISAIQNAMNLKIQDEASFFAEYQNEPLPSDTGDGEQLEIDSIVRKVNGMKKHLVSIDSNIITMFIDVQGKMLLYTIVAWGQNFSGQLIDYGTYPDQKRLEFTLADARITLKHKHPGTGLEGAIYAGLEALTEQFMDREFRRDDGALMKIDRCMIDANWGQSTDVVYQFCRESRFSARLLPSHGRYVGASSKPYTDYKKKRGDRVGTNWQIPNVKGKRAIRHAIYDTNYWKSFIRSRFFTAKGDPGSLTIFGRIPQRHQLLAEQCTSEYSIKVESRGREVDEWKLKAAGRDNHWFDCLVGCAVAASMEGAELAGASGIDKSRRSRRKSGGRRSSGGGMKLSELQRARGGGRR